MSQCHIAWQPWQLTLPSHIRITQARSASDNSVNNPVRWVVWCLPAGRLSRSHLRHSPAQPTFLLCGPHLFIVNPCNLYGWRGIVYSTTATLIADDALPLSVPAQLDALGRLALLA